MCRIFPLYSRYSTHHGLLVHKHTDHVTLRMCIVFCLALTLSSSILKNKENYEFGNFYFPNKQSNQQSKSSVFGGLYSTKLMQYTYYWRTVIYDILLVKCPGVGTNLKLGVLTIQAMYRDPGISCPGKF